jgi:hypothetical protein
MEAALNGPAHRGSHVVIVRAEGHALAQHEVEHHTCSKAVDLWTICLTEANLWSDVARRTTTAGHLDSIRSQGGKAEVCKQR